MNLRIAPLILALALSGCATVQPPFAAIPAGNVPPPIEAARDTARWMNQPVLWGGMIIEVRNYERHSEFEILAFPLDDKQRPMLEQRDDGRFIAIVPGYVEAVNWPRGRYVTLVGNITGDRRGAIREAEYIYPEVDADQMHLWPRDFRKPGPRISVGIGVGF
jgi:outer membrane lipoprotein